MLHSVLSRQLRKIGIDELTGPSDVEQWRDFLKRVGDTYAAADEDRYTLERSLGKSSEELLALNLLREKLFGSLDEGLRQHLLTIVARLESLRSPEIESFREPVQRLREKIDVLLELLKDPGEVHYRLRNSPSLLGEDRDRKNEQDRAHRWSEVVRAYRGASSSGSGQAARHHVLIVDSDPDFTAFLVGLLSPFYKLYFAEGPGDAKEVLNKGQISAMVFTQCMVQGSALDFLQELKKTGEVLRIPVIFIGRSAEEVDRIYAIEQGASEYLPIPFPERQLLVRLDQLIALRQHCMLAQDDLFQIGKLQRRLLPGSRQDFEGCQVSALFLPTGPLSGDLYQWRTDGEWLVVFLFDVIGHGAVASIPTFVLNQSLQGVLNGSLGSSLEEIVERVVSAYLTHDLDRDVAMQVVRYHPKTRALEYFRGNSPAASLVSADGAAPVTLAPRAAPSIARQQRGSLTAAKVQVLRTELKPGQTVFLFSDGAYELDPRGERFNRQMLCEILRNEAVSEDWQERVLLRIRESGKVLDFPDDLTILRLKIDG
jgi:serine phosphatase RsbU (regulator of sigma subunit)